MSDPTQHSIVALMNKLRRELMEAQKIVQSSCDNAEALAYTTGIKEILVHVEAAERFLETLEQH